MAIAQVVGTGERRPARRGSFVRRSVLVAVLLVIGLTAVGVDAGLAHSHTPAHPPLPQPAQLPAGYYAQAPVIDAQGQTIPGHWVGYEGLDDATCFALTWHPAHLLLLPFTPGTWTRHALTAAQCHTLIENAAPARK